jgi:hypothetical protein
MAKYWSENYDYNYVMKESTIRRFEGDEEKIKEWEFLSRNNRYLFFNKEGVRKFVRDHVKEYDAKSVLDYGNGGNRFLNHVLEIYPDVTIEKYDPFVEGLENEPLKSSDIVYCYNVLNVVETEYVEEVLKHIHECCNKVAFFNIPTPGLYRRKYEFYIQTLYKLDLFNIKEGNYYTGISRMNTIKPYSSAEMSNLDDYQALYLCLEKK